MLESSKLLMICLRTIYRYYIFYLREFSVTVASHLHLLVWLNDLLGPWFMWFQQITYNLLNVKVKNHIFESVTSIRGWETNEKCSLITFWLCRSDVEADAFFFFWCRSKNCDISVSSVVFFVFQRGEILGYSSVHCASVCGVFRVV